MFQTARGQADSFRAAASRGTARGLCWCSDEPKIFLWRAFAQRNRQYQVRFINLGFPLSRIFDADPKGRAAGFTGYLHYGYDQANPRDARRFAGGAVRGKSDMFAGNLQYKLNTAITARVRGIAVSRARRQQRGAVAAVSRYSVTRNRTMSVASLRPSLLSEVPKRVNTTHANGAEDSRIALIRSIRRFIIKRTNSPKSAWRPQHHGDTRRTRTYSR
ncbi:MAG: hypothetical protein ABR577_18525 [Pyrinomonadaceae bacterium]